MTQEQYNEMVYATSGYVVKSNFWERFNQVEEKREAEIRALFNKCIEECKENPAMFAELYVTLRDKGEYFMDNEMPLKYALFSVLQGELASLLNIKDLKFCY